MTSGNVLGDRVALVTGGARGQGLAESRALAAAGASVVIADVLEEEGEAAAEAIGEAARFQRLDVSSEVEWQAAIDATMGWFGGLDILVNNAGILLQRRLVDTTVEEFNAVVAVNQLGTFLGMKAAVAPMRARGGGCIVNVSSTGGLRGIPGMIAYSGTKFAVRGMTRTAALELGRFGIRVNAVLPGSVDTPMIAHIDPEGRYDRLPIPRQGTPEEIAAMVVVLASDASSYITGTDIVIDGGSAAGLP